MLFFQICKGKGYFCEFCRNDKSRKPQVIYPFEADVMCCPTCGFAFHLPCWLQNMQSCLKCARKQKRITQQVNDVM